MFKQIHAYTILVQGINTIFVHQMLIYRVFKKSTFYAGIKILNNLPSNLAVCKNEKVNYKI